MNSRIFDKIDSKRLQPVEGKSGTFVQQNPYDGNTITVSFGPPIEAGRRQFYRVIASYSPDIPSAWVAKVCTQKELEHIFPDLIDEERSAQERRLVFRDELG